MVEEIMENQENVQIPLNVQQINEERLKWADNLLKTIISAGHTEKYKVFVCNSDVDIDFEIQRMDKHDKSFSHIKINYSKNGWSDKVEKSSFDLLSWDNIVTNMLNFTNSHEAFLQKLTIFISGHSNFIH